MQTTYPEREHDRLIAEFSDLQKRLVPLWQHIGRSDPGSHELEAHNTVIVVPSITVELELDIASQQGYEERMLFMLFLLRQPHVHVIYLSSLPVASAIVDYYLDVLTSVTVHNARARLTMIATGDATNVPLVEKLLSRPHLLEQIRATIPDPEHAHMVPFLTTDLERDLAVRLQVPMYAADPLYFAFGTKSGCRRIFEEEGVPHPAGARDLHTAEELVRAIAAMRSKRPGLETVIVKHNSGVSGYGNATLELEDLPAPGSADEMTALHSRLATMRYELDGMTFDRYMDDLAHQGGVVEEMVTGEALVSPSAQLRITPLGEVERLSTHDQMLGGPSGQVYVGARFPADQAYSSRIMAEAAKVGQRLACEGIVGRFALDFIVVRNARGEWDPYAIEVNLRKGGTTHPFLTLQYLTDGRYDDAAGIYYTAQGLEKYYVATDSLKSELFRVFTPEDLFDIVSQHRLHFDHTTQTGVVLHMLSAVSSLGRLGCTAIGDSHAHAEEIYDRFAGLLTRIAAQRQQG